MALIDAVKNAGITLMTPRLTHLSTSDVAEYVNGLSAADMYRSQHAVRTVVGFIARNVAHLGLSCFERVDDADRRVDNTSPLAVALRRPDVNATLYETLYALAGDLALYDRAYWHVPIPRAGQQRTLRRIPPAMVTERRDTMFGTPTYEVAAEGDVVELPSHEVLAFAGWSPEAVNGCSPAIRTLKDVLTEQIYAAQYRGNVWRKGGRVSAVIERPTDASKWSEEARTRFQRDWIDLYTAGGPREGGTPILEDGMKLSRADFNARDQQYVEGAKLALTQVAAAWYVSPTMVGVLDNANYSNVREFRRSLYGETLGPTLRQIEHRINAFLLPMLGMDNTTYFVEFDSASKLRSPIDEEASALQTSVGGPWLTRNEARARQNLPAVEDGDELITPLNVLVGGQASPTDSGSQNRKSTDEINDAAVLDSLMGFSQHMAASVSSTLGAGGQIDWEKWKTKLAELVENHENIDESVKATIAEDLVSEYVGKVSKHTKLVPRGNLGILRRNYGAFTKLLAERLCNCAYQRQERR